MADVVVGAAGAPVETDSIVVPTVEAKAPAAEATAAPEPAAEQKTALAELIRKQREDRQARVQHEARAKDWETKYNDLSAEVERLKRDSDFESDPVAFARARGWDKEKQALMGQMLLYDLVPDKAPPDLRIRLFESKQAEQARKAEEQRKQREVEEQRAGQEQQFNAFVGMVEQAVQSFEAGSYPESEAWFVSPEGERDHDTYLRSLVATAVNMANVAQREGKVADLSPASIAKTLEAEVARRMTKRDQARQKVAQPGKTPVVQQGPAQPVGGMQPTESTKGIYGSGTPRPPALTDDERVARAAAVAFRTPGSR